MDTSKRPPEPEGPPPGQQVAAPSFGQAAASFLTTFEGVSFDVLVRQQTEKEPSSAAVRGIAMELSQLAESSDQEGDPVKEPDSPVWQGCDRDAEEHDAKEEEAEERAAAEALEQRRNQAAASPDPAEFERLKQQVKHMAEQMASTNELLAAKMQQQQQQASQNDAGVKLEVGAKLEVKKENADGTDSVGAVKQEQRGQTQNMPTPPWRAPVGSAAPGQAAMASTSSRQAFNYAPVGTPETGQKALRVFANGNLHVCLTYGI